MCNHVDRTMRLLKQYSQKEDDELRENCLQACEAFVIRCPDAVRPHIPMVGSIRDQNQKIYELNYLFCCPLIDSGALFKIFDL